MAERRSDAELVEGTRRGSEEAFGELVARYRDAVFGVAFHRLGNFEEARDVVQDVFVKAYLGLGDLRDPAAFARWLYRIADGTALDAARRPRREEPLTGAEIAPGPSPEAELSREVREIIARLSEPTRLAVVLHYVDGYTHAEVAHFLGTTPDAVKMRLSRARSKLREEMAEMAGARIRRAARPERRAFRYIVRDALGRELSGTAEAESAEMLARRLRGRGYFVGKIVDAGPSLEAAAISPLPERRRIYDFEARAGSGKVFSGAAEASSKAELKRRLRDRGYTATRMELKRPTPYSSEQHAEPARVDAEPIQRIVNVILEEAVKDRANVIRVELRKPETSSGTVVVLYLIGDTWDEIMSVPQYVWEPIRTRFLELAGESAEIRFPAEGTEHTARMKATEGEIRLTLAG